MAITVQELHESSTVRASEGEEVRIRQFLITSTAPQADTMWTEGDVAKLVRENTITGVPKLGDSWFSPGYVGAGTGAGGSETNQNLFGATQGAEIPILCNDIQVHIHAVSGSKTQFKYIATYSTKTNPWIPRLTIVTDADTETVYYDYDALLRVEGFSDSAIPINCDTWASITGDPGDPAPIPDPAGAGFDNWGHVTIIRDGDGVDVNRPRMVRIYRKFTLIENLGALSELEGFIYTTNADDPPSQTFPEKDKWLCEGISGPEIAPTIFDLEYRFSYNKNNHRPFFYENDQSSNWPIIDEGTGLPRCRSYRVYQRTDWTNLLASLGLP